MLAEDLLPSLIDYVNNKDFCAAMNITNPVLSYLAQGEYNLNYLLQSGMDKYVLRINTGSQMQLENQIEYEYKALQLLSHSGVTPQAYYLDDSKDKLPYGLLVMKYLLGEPLNYRYDLEKAAKTFARIHGMEFHTSQLSFLVKEPGPFTGIYNEAVRLLQVYFDCPYTDPEVQALLSNILQKAEERKKDELYLLREPWLCVINTEVNSNNFIVNRDKGTCHLIDWEKPIYGESAQDLSHFMIATTTLWKADYTLTPDEEKLFIDTYSAHLPPCPYKSTLEDRVEMFKFFNYLRAVSWCAMAWTEYIKPDRPLSNQDTFKKIKMYLEPEFLRNIFKFLK